MVALPFYNALRSAQLKLHYFEILLINKIDTQLIPEFILRSRYTMRTLELLSEEILNSVPLVLGDSGIASAPVGSWADAFRLLFPLLAIYWIPYVRQKQYEEAQCAIRRIGEQMGIRLALDYEPCPKSQQNSTSFIR